MVLITFDVHGNSAEVTLYHSGVPDDELGRQHNDGWTYILSETAELFEAKSFGRGVPGKRSELKGTCFAPLARESIK